MTSLLARLFGSRRRPSELTFTVYTRNACGCCHKALDLLRIQQRRYGFQIEEVDIDADPELVAKYDTEVPVVVLNGKVRFKGRINPALLERLLIAESRHVDAASDDPELDTHLVNRR
jgi:glutaredoxin